jgi:hypothetical protein
MSHSLSPLFLGLALSFGFLIWVEIALLSMCLWDWCGSAQHLNHAKDPLEVPSGPITRAKAKKFKEALNGLVQNTWSKMDLKELQTPSDANLMITWSRNPHVKTPIPGKPSKSGLIGVWHKDNLHLCTSTIGNGNPHPTNIDSRTRSIRMKPWRQLFFNKSFSSSLENHGREIISPTHTYKVRQTKSFMMRTSWSHDHATHTQRHQFPESQVNQVW